MPKPVAFFIFFSFLVFPSFAPCTVLTSDTVWSGEVSVQEDIVVPEGITLTVLPGTIIGIAPSESTKTDPEYMSPMTEITIRGTLVVEGSKELPVTFLISGENRSAWAGIIVDGGKAVLRSSIIRDAETALEVMGGSVTMSDSIVTGNRYGLTIHGQGSDVHVTVRNTQVQKNDYGIVLLNGAVMDSQGNEVAGNRKKDIHAAAARDHLPQRREYKAEQRDTTRVYGDEALLGVTVWQKRIEVRGILRVPEGSRLLIMPGTIVEFAKKDTNNDGIGENGILIQGVIIAKGTTENPIIFRSAEKQRRMGDWDSINIMNSDRAQNLIEHCQIEDAYRGLHFHFSIVAVTGSVLRNNYRGIQFQESIVEIRDTHVYGNKSGIQARDSEITFSDNAIYQNYSGMNVFRTTIGVKNSSFLNNREEGLRIREGIPVVEESLLVGNRHGLMVNGTVYGTFRGNIVSHNLESGVALKDSDNIEISGNILQQNSINGITVQDSGGVIIGNLISDNKERGIGVLSFQGVITGNNILSNALYNLGIEGKEDVSASNNWWGDGDVRKSIYDKENDPARGRADYLPTRNAPVIITWPVSTVAGGALWHGDIQINGSVTVQPGADLIVAPKARVRFSKGAGLVVKGKITARGERDARILFLAGEEAGAGGWNEILLDHAKGSAFSYATFSDATWALHSHFTDLLVEDCAFLKNYGGIRFTAGPIRVKRSLFRDNEIGIRAFRGIAEITENMFTGNRIGIFVREKGGELTIRRNNLFANSGYNIRIGDFNDEDVSAQSNWWGPGNPADTIYDGRLEPGIGTVYFEPYLTEPVRTVFKEVP